MKIARLSAYICIRASNIERECVKKAKKNRKKDIDENSELLYNQNSQNRALVYSIGAFAVIFYEKRVAKE